MEIWHPKPTRILLVNVFLTSKINFSKQKHYQFGTVIINYLQFLTIFLFTHTWAHPYSKMPTYWEPCKNHQSRTISGNWIAPILLGTFEKWQYMHIYIYIYIYIYITYWDEHIYFFPTQRFIPVWYSSGKS